MAAIHSSCSMLQRGFSHGEDRLGPWSFLLRGFCAAESPLPRVASPSLLVGMVSSQRRLSLAPRRDGTTPSLGVSPRLADAPYHAVAHAEVLQKRMPIVQCHAELNVETAGMERTSGVESFKRATSALRFAMLILTSQSHWRTIPNIFPARQDQIEEKNKRGATLLEKHRDLGVLKHAYMEVIFSAAMGELASRSISFLVDRYLKHRAAPTEEESLRSLQQLLLRLHVVVEEADCRLITNQAMLHQLSILKKEMYRGYYTLDFFSCRAHGEERTKDHEVNYSFAPSVFNPAKRVCFCSGNNQGASQAKLLEQVLGSIRDIIKDVSEFVMFLCRCPHLHRQPYSMYLLLDKFMFGRQMEMEHVMNFLLQEESAHRAAQDPAVLPIIGQGKVGKSTLIEHACVDERVRSHFFQILCFNGDDLKDASVETLRDRGRIKHQNRGMAGGRTLIIIELFLDIEESLWKRLYLAVRSCIVSGSKIIVASRFDKIASFGTTQPLRLQCLTPEAYWYFFKVRTFGSTSAEDHPKLTAIAMDMARLLNGCFMGAAIYSGLLKTNFNHRFWTMALATLRNIQQKNILLYGERSADAWEFEEPAYLRRAKKTSSECLVILSDYQTCSAETEPEDSKMISVQDLLFGSVRPRGNFKVHAWTSHLPPYYNYMFHCGIRRPQRTVANMKRHK